ncbi:MAG TPA: VOC family protein [Micromonosporaceae bacterium]|jgi:catechol 2,3-dioxygenase-like lactoylglutathione lyase family enzyme
MRVRPVRFTENVAAMREFLQELGLRPNVESESGGWVDLVGDAPGMAALHDAASNTSGYRAGETALSFESDEPLEAVRDRLHAAGFADAHIVDEAYGRTLFVTDPDGVRVAIDEEMTDLYGYARFDDRG